MKSVEEQLALIPRPDTELLVEAALELLPATPAKVLDLGEWRFGRLVCGLNGFSSVLILCQLFCRTFQFKAQGYT